MTKPTRLRDQDGPFLNVLDAGAVSECSFHQPFGKKEQNVDLTYTSILEGL